MSEPITYWKWARDGMVVAACPEIQDDLYIIRERYDALHAKIRELEERLGEVEAGRECVHIDEYQALQDRVHELEAKLRQVEGWQYCQTHGSIDADHHWGCPDCVRELRQERDQARADTQSLRELVGQWIWAMYLTPESYECRTIETYRQAVEARVRQLEEMVQAELPPPIRRLEQQELLRLRARVGELEEALRTVSSVGRNILKPKFDHCGFMNATQLGNRDAVLHMLKQVERALEGERPLTTSI